MAVGPIHHRRDTQPVHAVRSHFSSENVTWGACLIHVGLPVFGAFGAAGATWGATQTSCSTGKGGDFLM
jgi:hypothetical protein